MNLIKRITDADFLENEDYIYMDTPTRYGARGVLYNDKNEIAMMYMETKGCYKLPGGGVENNETKEEAFLREVLEETGYTSEIIKELGIIEEHKIKNNFMHLSYCFAARALSKHEVSLTEHEISLGFKLVWMKLEDAIKAMDKSMENCDDYKMKFMLLRDITILSLINDKSKGEI